MSSISAKKPRRALLTILALPIPVIAALVVGQCHGAYFGSNPADVSNFSAVPGPAASASGQTITGLIVSPGTLVGGQSSTGTVYLRYPAPAGGLSITLKNGDPNRASLPERVVIPEGRLSANFPITTKAVSNHVAVNVEAASQATSTTSVLTLIPVTQRRWYVSPKGNPVGSGTQESPWDLATALAHGPTNSEVKPGDTIWMLPGRYVGTFISKLEGRQDAPIVVRAHPGGRVVLDKASVGVTKQPALKVKNSWVWFWGIEVMNSYSDRSRNSPYSGKDEPWRGSGADVYAPHVKFINMIFHDNGHGIWDKKDQTEVHGCLFFYNGNNKREHALYIGNSKGRKYITDNIVFDQGGYGILGHSDSLSSEQKGLHFEGNIAFNNGILTGDDQKTGNMQVGGVTGVPAEQIVIKNNYLYNSLTNSNNKNYGIRLGYEDKGNRDVRLLDNYIVSKFPLRLWWWQSVEVQGNVIHSSGETVDLVLPSGVSAGTYRWNFNSYFSAKPVFTVGNASLGFSDWRRTTGLDHQSDATAAGRPSGVRVFIRPNRYEAGRGHVAIFNWDLRDYVAVDLSSVLALGANFEIRDAQNYFGEPVIRGTYKGEPILIPTKLVAKPAPVGNVERIPQHTSPEFGVFVVQTLTHKGVR